MICISAILPIFIIMAVGYYAGASRTITRDAVLAVNRSVFKTLLPFLLFYNIYNSDFVDFKNNIGFILFGVIGILFLFLISVLYVYRTEELPEKRGPLIQGMFRSSYAIIGFPLVKSLLGTEDIGLSALLLAFIAPELNVLSAIILELNRGRKVALKKLLISVFTNPIVASTLLALLIRVLNIRIPNILNSIFGQIGNAASVLLMFLLGAFFEFKGLAKYKKEILNSVAVKLVIFPGVMLAIAALLGFKGEQFAALIPLFGSATSVNTFTMSQALDADGELAGDIVVVTSALSPLSLFVLAYISKTLMLF